MFYFYSTEQGPTNASFYRGLLFENLLRIFLKAAAYEVEVTRRKHSSLEYDIEGKHLVDGRNIIGEAKAHADTIGGQDLAAFVGKCLPFFHGGENYSSLFLSTSPLSPEAEDYYRNLTGSTPYQITRITGANLEQQIRTRLGMPGPDEVHGQVGSAIPVQSGQHLLHTNRGPFILVTGSAVEAAFDDRFALVSERGAVVTDGTLLHLVKQGIPALQELEPVYPEETKHASVAAAIGVRSIPYGLVTASDWFDYRRPASKGYFVGRVDPISRVNKVITAAGSGTVLEIKSRSGVGKSSLLAVLAQDWSEKDYLVELHDARDIQSANDVLKLVERFTKSADRVRAFEDVPALLKRACNGLGNGRAIFMVDQFESTFQSAEVFSAYEYIALAVTKGPPNLAMLFTRKDDLLTTHDDIIVNLDRLRSVSQSVTLEDFTRDEALSLLGQIAKAHSGRLSAKILPQVLEFAQGFPWLLKRTMAHVIATISKGVKQQELLSSGLHLSDLFQEEVAELDEHERGYLIRLASVLPSTYQALARRFEDDPLLRPMLEKLTHRKLLRLSAGSYDTYNDVFKDYLLYERLPERPHSHLLRMGPVPVMQAFRALGGQTRFDTDELGAKLGKTLGGIHNLLRELRLVGLVTSGTDGWIVPDVVRQYEHQGRLGEYVRQSILKNRVVSELLALIEKAGSFPKGELTGYLRRHFPFVEAKDDVWASYTNIMLDWLTRLQFVEVKEDDDTLHLVRRDKEEILKELSNLILSARVKRPPTAPFLPTAAWPQVMRLFAQARAGIDRAGLKRTDQCALTDLKKLGILEESAEGKWVSDLSEEQMIDHTKGILSSDPYKPFWERVARRENYTRVVQELFDLDGHAQATCKSFGKRLVGWGRALGLSPAVRAGKPAGGTP